MLLVPYVCDIAFTPLLGDSGVCLAGFLSSDACSGLPLRESRGCRDALIGESYLTLAFADRLESWDLQKEEKTPAWSMEIKTPPESSGNLGQSFDRATRSVMW